ncbi:hypothetical protein DFH08DRAFT_950778 [Mycena albidolilacea]|uniref:Uncharacterized protein n=1 Tax=Mycena albidolilacea TaxID=1033008 RepID=A0AAD7ALV8_9AGAR|nr:hypothetical protein DFH08DRAFT_950778 [Mycena albidolilacea]
MSISPTETAPDLRSERLILAGLFLGTVGYGVHFTLFVECFQALLLRKDGRRNKELLAFICILFTLGNVGNAANLVLAQKTFIDNRTYPGGPNAFFLQQSTNWSAVLYSAISYAPPTVVSAILIARLSQPGNTIWTKISINLAVPYLSISISMTIILTMLIAGRLLFMRSRLRKVMGPNMTIPYVTSTAMLVESATLYSVNGLILLISYGLNSAIQHLALPLLGQTQSIAPLLIILRVARGQAWSDKTTVQFSSVQFRPRPASGMSNEMSATVLHTFNTNLNHCDNVEQGREEDDKSLEFRKLPKSSV